MTALRDTGSTYPVEVVDETARITFVEQRDVNADGVIDRALGELPRQVCRAHLMNRPPHVRRPVT